MLKFARAKPVGLLLLLYLSRAPALPAQVEKAGSLPAAAPAQTKPKKTEQPPAPELPVSAQAQQLSYDRVNEIVTLKGEVTVTNPPFTISGDEMEIYLKTNIVRALKNVRVVKTQNERQSEVILADFAELNMDTGAGYLIAGKMTLPTDTGSVTITGDKMEKINDNLYRFHQGSFTSCSCAEGQKPDWAMQAQEINADTNGTAKLKSVRVLIRGAKIMYLPYAEAPISDTRKSGFLTPEFGYSSRGGYQAGLPYFLVLGPSADLTIYPTYIQ